MRKDRFSFLPLGSLRGLELYSLDNPQIITDYDDQMSHLMRCSFMSMQQFDVRSDRMGERVTKKTASKRHANAVRGTGDNF